MYLSNLKLWNFRKFGSDEDFDLEKSHLDLNFNKGVNLLIGENDSGKSAIIDAIKLVLKTHSYEYIKVTKEDFYKNSDRLRIEIIIENLADDEAKNFVEWLGWEKETKTPYLRLIYDVKRNIKEDYIFPSEVRAGTDENGTPLSAEAREYLKITYLKPLRDAEFELVSRKNSRLSQILMGHEVFKNADDHILIQYLKEFNEAITKYFLGEIKTDGKFSENDNTAKKIKDSIDELIRSFFGDNEKEVEFKITKEEKLKNILEKLDLILKDYINPGLGTLNRIFIASELIHLNRSNWNGLRLGLIEEVEAHLHPQAQLQVIEALQKQEKVQLILTTHSPNIGSKIKLENLIICYGKNAFPMGKKYTKLKEEDYKFLERFLDVTKANLFFAKGVILVEGWSEEILLPALAKKLKKQRIISKDLTEAGVSIVNVGGTSFFRYAKIFLRKKEPYLDIPVAIITDIDVPEYKKIKDDENENEYKIVKLKDEEIKIKKYEKLKTLKENIGVNEETNVKVFVAPRWTFEYSIYQSESLKKVFCEIFKSIHSGSGINQEICEEKLAEKLVKGTLKKTEIAYRLAKRIEEDEAIKLNENDEGIQYLIEAIKYVCKN